MSSHGKALLALWVAIGAGPAGAEEWRTYTKKDGLVHHAVRALAVDVEGRGLWVGTAGGISWLDPARGAWQSYREAEGLPSDDVRCLALFGGTVYAGTAKGLARFAKETKKWVGVGAAEGVPGGPVNALLADGASLWIGTDRGLHVYELLRGVIKVFGVEDGLVDPSVRALVAEADQIFVGTVGAALHAYDKTRKRWRVFTPTKRIFTNIVLGVERNRVWSGTNGGGIRVYNKTTGEWKTMTLREGLSDEFLQSLCVDGRYLWFGTFDGVSRFDTKTETWRTVEAKDGLADGSVAAMAVDGGWMWFGTDQGLSRLSKGSPEVRVALPASAILTKDHVLTFPVTVRNLAPLKSLKVETSALSFPDVWGGQGVTLIQVEGAADRWIAQWDPRAIPSDFETVFLRVSAVDEQGGANEHVVSVQVDTVLPRVTLDPFSVQPTAGVWTVSGTINKTTIEDVTVQPGGVKAKVDRARKTYSALVLLPEGPVEVSALASDIYGRTASERLRLTVGKAGADQSFAVQPMTGTSVRLVLNEKLLFDSGRAELKVEARPVLEKVLELLRHNPKTRARVEGHTDNVPVAPGSPFKSNAELSQGRARTVYDFLAGRGIPSARLSMVGYGELRPVGPNETEEGRAQNRRVEIGIEVMSEDR